MRNDLQAGVMTALLLVNPAMAGSFSTGERPVIRLLAVPLLVFRASFVKARMSEAGTHLPVMPALLLVIPAKAGIHGR